VHRFFAPTLDPGDESATLPREEAEHLTRVLRLGVGDSVSVFDGRGHEFLAKVASVAGRDVRVQIVSRIEPAAEASVALTLVQAVLKTDKMDDIVRDAVMLGVAAIQPIVSKRTETTVATLMKSARVERWRRVALSSAKQSRRAVLPEIRMPLALDTYLGDPPPALQVMLVEPSGHFSPGAPVAGPSGAESLSEIAKTPAPPDAALLVGPEGGWTEEECATAAARGVRLVTLGQRTLRADAVPVAAISVLQYLWGDL
jgi:16S rRNA (uracil1498-N3)-methyltransferase